MCFNSMLQVVGVVDITTLNNRQYCVILDPVDKDGRPQLGQKRLVKVPVIFYILIGNQMLFYLISLHNVSMHRGIINHLFFF